MDSVLHHFQKLLGRGQEAQTPDSQLVDRFAASRDEKAFETLLHRHAPLVWGVCKRVLRDAHLAEDAFQATFLVLAREAHSIRKRQSVGSWLYGVAYRLAHRIRSNALERRQPRPADTTGESDLMTDIIRRELRPVLDAELQALPEKYRAPLILCYLEGKTHEEAARELGWPTGTMSRRLNKARSLLRQRLMSRGVTLTTVVLTAALVKESTAAVPFGLVATTLRASLAFATGQALVGAGVSVKAVMLAEAMIKAAAVTKLKFAAVLSLLTLLVATGTGMVVFHVARASSSPVESTSANEKSYPDRSEESTRSSANPVSISTPAINTSGWVVDGNGKPIVGAKAYLSEWADRRTGVPSFFDFKSVIAEAATGPSGQFALKDAKASHSGAWAWDLVVLAPGHGLAFKPAILEDDNKGATFVLGPEATVFGKLVDQHGRPVKGARVDLYCVAGLHDPVLPSPRVPGVLYLAPSELGLHSKTDGKGEFRLHGMPKDSRLTLLVSHNDFQRELVYVATTKQRLPDLFDTSGGQVRRCSECVYPAVFTHTLNPGHRVHGGGVREDDGLPVPAGQVSLQPAKQSAGGPGGVINGRVFSPDSSPLEGVRVDKLWHETEHARTTTNAAGQFVVRGDFPAALRFIHYGRRLGALVREDQLRDQRGEIQVILAPLGRVEGRVVDENHNPVAGALVQLHYKEDQDGDATVANALVDADGRFEFSSIIPGCPYEIEAWANGYTRDHRELGTPANGDVYKLPELTLRKAGASMAGRIFGQEGSPVADAILVVTPVQSGSQTYNRILMQSDKDGLFAVSGVPAGVLQIGIMPAAHNSQVIWGPRVDSGRKDIRLVFDRAANKFAK
jgi:RNA polymerase sigma factor (sigma-70 family)